MFKQRIRTDVRNENKRRGKWILMDFAIKYCDVKDLVVSKKWQTR